jgi:pyrroline-5-carboxylate reductase
MKELCVIGSGNMGKAIVKGILKAGLLETSQVIVTDINEEKVKRIEKELSISGSCDNQKAAAESHIVILAVKPQFYKGIIKSIQNVIKPETIIVSIAPGETLEKLERGFKEGAKIIRAMPNTPAMVLEGMTALCGNSNVTKIEMEHIKKLFNGFGRVEEVPEYMMNSVVGISGSSPAYVCLLIEAMADAAVKEGVNRQQAYTFSEQAVMGSAKLLLETSMSPSELKDMVCSPGGTSIEAVSVLEEKGFRGSVIKAVEACVKKSMEL